MGDFNININIGSIRNPGKKEILRARVDASKVKNNRSIEKKLLNVHHRAVEEGRERARYTVLYPSLINEMQEHFQGCSPSVVTNTLVFWSQMMPESKCGAVYTWYKGTIKRNTHNKKKSPTKENNATSSISDAVLVLDQEIKEVEAKLVRMKEAKKVLVNI